MKEATALVLDETDERAAALLMDLGFARNVARALILLKHVDEAVSREIEQGATLRQPEVSLAMQDLRERGWVTKRDIKREGKGRPLHAYRLAVSFDQILNSIDADQRRHAASMAEKLERLRTIAQG